MSDRVDAVAVIAVTYNSSRDIEGFLNSLEVFAGEIELRVVVADNASLDDTVARARAHRRDVELVQMGGNHGYSAGINAALRRLGTETTVVIANPDVRFQPGFLEALLPACEQPGVGVAVPRLIEEDGSTQLSLRRDPSVARALAEALLGGRRAARWGLGETIGRGAAYERAADVEWATGALLLLTPRCLRRVGLWDESFFLYSEETDYLLRVRDAGLTIRYEPRAAAVHRGGDLHVNPRLWTVMALNRVRLFGRRHGRVHAVAFWLAVLLNEMLRVPVSRPHRVAARELLRHRSTIVRGDRPSYVGPGD